MTDCNNKIKQRCKKVYASCTMYESEVNTNSTLDVDDCLTIEETTQDIYTQLEQINLSNLGNSCLEYVEQDGKLYVKNVLKKFEDEICALKEEVENLNSRNILDTPLGEFNVWCLEGQCENEILTLRDWMNSVTTRFCD